MEERLFEYTSNEGRATLIFIHGVGMGGFHLCGKKGSYVVAVFLNYRREGVTLLFYQWWQF